MGTAPEHKVTITYDKGFKMYHVYCLICGRLSGVQKTKKQAKNRKSTHERGQDAGAD